MLDRGISERKDGGTKMAISYRKLWHILIDRGMKKRELEKAAGITHYQMYKLANSKDITTDVVEAICKALGVGMQDILEFVPDDTPAAPADEPERISGPVLESAIQEGTVDFK